MPQTNVSPQIAYATNVFYDRNNNPLNIPCEGPRIIVVPFSSQATTTGADFDTLVISTNNISQSNFSCCQSFGLDLSQFAKSSVSINWNMACAGTNFRATGAYVAGTTNLSPSLVVFPIATFNPAQITLNIAPTGQTIGLNVYLFNYMVPPFNVLAQ